MTRLEETSRDKVASWYSEYAEAIFSYAARRVGADIAADVTSEVFSTAWQRWETYDAELGAVRPWLMGIATNVLRRHWRTERRLLRLAARASLQSDVVDNPTDRIAEKVYARENVGELLKVIERLKPTDRDLIFLIAWQELSPSQAAEVLGIPEGTARSRLSRIRSRLRREIDHG